jgi:hypothetical protein
VLGGENKKKTWQSTGRLGFFKTAMRLGGFKNQNLEFSARAFFE